MNVWQEISERAGGLEKFPFSQILVRFAVDYPMTLENPRLSVGREHLSFVAMCEVGKRILKYAAVAPGRTTNACCRYAALGSQMRRRFPD